MVKEAAMLFEADSVVSGYGALEVLHGVSLSIEEGEIVSVLGANGAGKTTFLRTVSGVLDTWEGKITLEGADLGPLSTERRAMAGLGHLPEGRGIFQNLTVRENLDIGLGLRKDGAGEIRRDRDRLLDLLPALSEKIGSVRIVTLSFLIKKVECPIQTVKSLSFSKLISFHS